MYRPYNPWHMALRHYTLLSSASAYSILRFVAINVYFKIAQLTVFYIVALETCISCVLAYLLDFALPYSTGTGNLPHRRELCAT